MILEIEDAALRGIIKRRASFLDVAYGSTRKDINGNDYGSMAAS